MTNPLKPGGGVKPIWDRSATRLTALLVTFKGFAPDAPWWAYLIISSVWVVGEQVFAPSVARKTLP